MDTLLVVGGSGLLGGKVCAAAREGFHVVGTHRGTPPTIERVRFVELHKDREEDVARPVNYYGETKLAGEHAVLAASPDHLVVRPSVVFGWDDTRLNFATWILTSLKDGKSVNVATDWIGSPTFADSLAAGILKLLAVPEGGVYHLAGVDAISRHDFAVRLAKAFALDVGLVRPVRSADLKLKARRPADSSLSSAKA